MSNDTAQLPQKQLYVNKAFTIEFAFDKGWIPYNDVNALACAGYKVDAKKRLVILALPTDKRRR